MSASEDSSSNFSGNRAFSSEPAEDLKGIASYEEVKDLPNHKEKMLIDVREPQELIDTGVIPTSINIPRKL
jgi:3-mercaptopyruvate sulfurtransferase SseA